MFYTGYKINNKKTKNENKNVKFYLISKKCITLKGNLMKEII